MTTATTTAASTTSHTLDHYAGLLVLAPDPEQATPNDVPPAPLTVEQTTPLAEQVAKDLAEILDGIGHVSLVLPGALYDQTEVLRPEWPLTQALADVYQRGAPACGDFVPHIMALGTDKGFFPIAAINPQRAPGAGPLLVIPFCVVGPKEAIRPLSHLMEDRLLQDGNVSEATRQCVEQAFGITVQHLSFATLVDLFSLLSVQLENNGLLPLWELLEHTIFQRAGLHAVQLDSGNTFLSAEDHVHTLFYTFNDFAQWGPGRDVPARELAAAYCHWVQAQRHYTIGLEVYGIHVRRVLANPHLAEILRTSDVDAQCAAFKEIPCLSGDYLVEGITQTESDAKERHMLITHHADNVLGTLLYSVRTEDAQGQLLRFENHYPLHNQGVSVIIDRLIDRCTEQGAERVVLHPGEISFDPDTRSLSNEPLRGFTA